MKRKPVLNFFDISSDLEELPENELFKLKGGDSDVAWEVEGDIIDVYPPGEEPEEPEYPEPEEPEEPWETDENDWEGDDGSEDLPPPPEEEEEEERCTCAISKMPQMGSGQIYDGTNNFLGNFENYVQDTINKLSDPEDIFSTGPNTEHMLTTMNKVQSILDQMGSSKYDFEINFGTVNGSPGETTYEDGKIVITIDKQQLTSTQDRIVFGETIPAGTFNEQLAMGLLSHELMHVDQILNGRLSFEFGGNNAYNFGLEDEVEAFQFQESFNSGPMLGPVKVTENLVKNFVLKDEQGNPVLDTNKNPIKPYNDLTNNGGNCPIHGVNTP